MLMACLPPSEGSVFSGAHRCKCELRSQREISCCVFLMQGSSELANIVNRAANLYANHIENPLAEAARVTFINLPQNESFNLQDFQKWQHAHLLRTSSLLSARSDHSIAVGRARTKHGNIIKGVQRVTSWPLQKLRDKKRCR